VAEFLAQNSGNCPVPAATRLDTWNYRQWSARRKPSERISNFISGRSCSRLYS